MNSVTIDLTKESMLLLTESSRTFLELYTPSRDKTKACKTNKTAFVLKNKQIVHYSIRKADKIILSKVPNTPTGYSSKFKIDISDAAKNVEPGLNFLFDNQNPEQTLLIGEGNARSGIINGIGFNLNVQDVYIELVGPVLSFFVIKTTKTPSNLCPIDKQKEYLYKLNDSDAKSCKLYYACKKN